MGRIIYNLYAQNVITFETSENLCKKILEEESIDFQLLLIDCRNSDNFESGHIKGAMAFSEYESIQKLFFSK